MSMSRNCLPETNIEVSALGFGCVRLTTCRTEALAHRTLETAFDQGITHFDTARLYGVGHSERILGRFLRGRRDRVTIATKVGLMPSTGLASCRLLVTNVKRVLSPFPSLLDHVRNRAAGGVADSRCVPRGVFDIETVRRSLETSLKALATDYVDLLLLHEAAPEDAVSEPLQEFLAGQRRRGTVRAIGVASDFAKFRSDAALVPQSYNVLQFDHNAAAPHLSALACRAGRGTIVFNIFAPLARLVAAAEARPDVAQVASELVGADLASPRDLRALLLHYALATNSGGITLFSSVSPENIAANATEAERDRFDCAQLAAFSNYAQAACRPH